MDKLGDRVQFCHVGDFFLEEILNRFDVVVGGALDRFDALCIFYAEIGDDFIKVTVCVGSKAGTSLIAACAAGFATNALLPERGNFSKPNSLKIPRSALTLSP